MQKIIPHLWFDDQAEEAARFYTSLFDGSRTGPITRYGSAGYEIHRQPEGRVMTIDFDLAGFRFIALNGGPHFKFNPSISFFVVCETEPEIDKLWEAYSDGGMALMPLDKYPWSDKYGWVQDRYGVSWQLSLGKMEDVGQKITPSLLFVGDQAGRAEAAINLYTTIFDDSEIMGILRYSAGEDEPEGHIKHAQFKLSGEAFMAMDSSIGHNFSFNEAISLLVTCITQEEVDYFWRRLSEGGDEKAQQCGWLKDRFGVSWQVGPIQLSEMLRDKDPEKVNRVTTVMLRMKKLDLNALKAAYQEG